MAHSRYLAAGGPEVSVTPMVRAQSLRGYRDLVVDLGGDPDQLLHDAGLDPSALDQLTAFISFERSIDLLERSATELACADFGLRLAERQDLGILGTLAVGMRNSATVGDALACAAKYLPAHNAAVAFAVNAEQRQRTTLVLRVLGAQSQPWAQTAEHGIGLAWRITTLLSEAHCRLREVWLPHAAVGARSAYRRRFDAPLKFQADHAALAVATADLRLAISEHNDELHAAAVKYLDRNRPGSSAPYRAQVHHAIEALLGTGTCSYGPVAATLHIHPRTLQRRLREEGTTFEAIKEQTRRQLVRRYLSQPDLPLTQITTLLDYSDQSALDHSCRRWFHTTPRELRDQLTPQPIGNSTA
jgi:AraC-like DNA-binding protein